MQGKYLELPLQRNRGGQAANGLVTRLEFGAFQKSRRSSLPFSSEPQNSAAETDVHIPADRQGALKDRHLLLDSRPIENFGPRIDCGLEFRLWHRVDHLPDGLVALHPGLVVNRRAWQATKRRPDENRTPGCPRFRSSDFQEKFAPVHPQQDEPITQQNDRAAEERFKPCAGQPKEIGTQVDAQGAV